MKITGIYSIKSITHTDRLYIGSSIDINQRWNNHLKTLRLNTHRNKRLQGHFNKYGEKDLVFEIIELCDQYNLLYIEQKYINSLHPSFNICKIAGSPLGIKWSEKSRIKFSARQKGRKLSEEHKLKIGISCRGRIVSKETRDKISKGEKGKEVSIETRTKIGNTKKGNTYRRGTHLSEATKLKLRKANLGKIVSEKTKEKMRIIMTGRKMPQWAIDNMKKGWELKKQKKYE